MIWIVVEEVEANCEVAMFLPTAADKLSSAVSTIPFQTTFKENPVRNKQWPFYAAIVENLSSP